MVKHTSRLNSLRTRIFIFFFILDVLLSGLLGLVSIINDRYLQSLYESDTKEQALILQRRIDDKNYLTQAMVSDYSVWDDTYNYLLGELPEYPELNISEESLGTFKSDIVLIYNNDFSLATSLTSFEQKIDLSSKKQQILQLLSTNNIAHFHVATDNGFLEVYGASVVRSNDYEHKNTPAGYFFVGRLITSSSLAELKDEHFGSIELVKPKDINQYPSKLPAKQGILAISLENDDIDGEPVGYIYARYRDDSIVDMYQMLTRLLLLNGLTFLLLVIAVSLAAWLWVTRPLNKIYDALDTEDMSKVKSILAKKTEFGKIAQLIDKFFEQEKLVEAETKESKKLLEKLTASNTEIEKTSNVMIGRELKMIDLKKEIKLLQDRLKDKK